MNPQNKITIIPGDRFGRWTVIRESESLIGFYGGRKAAKRMLECRCDCGTVKTIGLGTLRNGSSTSCGCSTREQRKRIPAIPGTKINRLTIIKELPMKGLDRRVLCLCECGNEKEISFLKLKQGGTMSCGCYHIEIANSPKLNKRGENHEHIETRLYEIWCGMKKRCNNTKARAYKWYGAKGVRVCLEWEQRFLNFYEWAISHGYSDALTIERIDSSKNYEPSNCKWIPLSDQNNNKCSSRYIEYAGVKMTIKDASEKYGIYYQTLIRRLNKGWSVNKSIETPTKK